MCRTLGKLDPSPKRGPKCFLMILMVRPKVQNSEAVTGLYRIEHNRMEYWIIQPKEYSNVIFPIN